MNFGLDAVLERERLQKFGLDNSNPVKVDISVPFIIQTNITRFGPMLIILFFVSILINLYRYDMRLAAYYDARADALRLCGSDLDIDVFTELTSSLSPDLHDIGKPPKLPTDYLIDVAKTAIGNSKNET